MSEEIMGSEGSSSLSSQPSNKSLNDSELNSDTDSTRES